MAEHPFSNLSNFTSDGALRQDLFVELCDADRESFVVDGRSTALLLSGLILAICFCFVCLAANLYFTFRVRVKLVAKENQSSNDVQPVVGDKGDIEASGVVSSVQEANRPSSRIENSQVYQSTRTALAKQETAIYCRDLSYFPSTKATLPILKQVSVQMCYGSLVAVMGPSGSGKTTFLDFVSGRRDFGEYVGDASVSSTPVADITADDLRKVGYMRQFESYPESLTVASYLYFTGTQVGVPEDQLVERVRSCVNRVGMKSFLHVPIRGLSGGQKRRLGVARLLLNAPRILFLDEPTSGLDATSSLEVISTLKDLSKDGFCIVITIHQPRMELFELFTDVFVLVAGRVALHNRPPNGPKDCYMEMCKRLGVRPKEHYYNPADAMIDLLENVKGWQKVRLWFHHSCQRKRDLRKKLANTLAAAQSSSKKNEIERVPVEVRKRKSDMMAQFNAIFPTWFGNSPLDVSKFGISIAIALFAYFVLVQFLFGPCTLPYLIGFTATGFLMQNAVINFVVTNFAVSLSDTDNMLKERVLNPTYFLLFHVVMYCAVVFLFNVCLWLGWMPWVLLVGIPLENTIVHLAAMTMSGMIFAAGSLLFMINTKDPSNSAAVTSALGSLNLCMALMTAFNGLSVPNQLFDRAPWLLWLSFNYPASVSLIQSILEGQEINCESERCVDINASLFVSILDFTKYNEAHVPILVLLIETIVVWIAAGILMNRRCIRKCPVLRSSVGTATLAVEAPFFRTSSLDTPGNEVKMNATASEPHAEIRERDRGCAGGTFLDI